MQMRPDLQIQSMIKAMTDVVLPAVDPNNKLAQEQARLVVGMLSLLAGGLPLQYRFDRDELGRLVTLARDLEANSKGGSQTAAAVAALAAAREQAAQTWERARIEPAELLDAVRELRQLSGALVTAVCADGDSPSQAHTRDSVLASSKEQLLRDRSWLLAQGWEPDPKAVPPIEELLAGD
jgi:hypothetical protein